MKSLIETEILLEVALKIGNSLDLNKMLGESVSTMMRLLNLSAAQVIHAKIKPHSETIEWETVLSIPRTIVRNTDFRAFLERALLPETVAKWEEWSKITPLSKNDGKKIRYLFSLHGFGVLVFEKNGKPFDTSLIQSLQPILFKLSNAALACVALNEQKEAKQALLISESRYRSVITVSNTGAWEYNTKSKYLWCSPEYFEMLGRDPKDFLMDGTPNLEETWINLLHPDDRQNAVDYFAEYLKNGSVGLYENFFRMEHADGSWVWIWSRGQTLRNANGSVSDLTVGTHINITEGKQAEEELIKAKDKAEESDRLKTAFLHNISHEIRTPMNTIVGFSALLGEPDLNSQSRKDYIEMIMQGSNHLLSMVCDIIDFSNIEAGIVKIAKNEINVNNTLKTIFNQFIKKANEKNVNLVLETEVPGPDSLITADSAKLTQIITNLVSNALKFTNKGYVKIGCERRDKYLEFWVSDTGIGISEEHHKNIFDRFYQVQHTNSRLYEGTGLGLAISKANVELMGGKIWFTSEPGKGTTFCFTIPYEKKVAKTPAVK